MFGFMINHFMRRSILYLNDINDDIQLPKYFLVFLHKNHLKSIDLF